MGPIVLITITTHHTRPVTSYNEAPWINVGPYCRTLLFRDLTDPQKWKQASSLNRTTAVFVSSSCSPCKYSFTNSVLRHETLIESNCSCLIRMQLRQFRCISYSLRRHAPLLCKSRTTFVKISSDYHQFRPSYSSVRTYLLFSCCWKWNALLEAFWRNYKLFHPVELTHPESFFCIYGI
jgi:hypothetical protein